MQPGSVDEGQIRVLTPQVITVLVRRGADFAAAEDALVEALVEALRIWPHSPPRDPKGWLVTVAWRKFLDVTRAESSRRRRELKVGAEPQPGAVGSANDTLALYFLCARPSLSPSSAVALTLRAVGGLTTRQIAAAYLVGEATMAQRISRAKRTVAGVGLDTVRFDTPGDVATVLRVLLLGRRRPGRRSHPPHPAAVLRPLGQWNQPPALVGPRRTAGVVQQHQRQ